MSNPAHEKSMPDEGAKGSRHGQPLIGGEDALEALRGGLYRTLNIGPCCINVKGIGSCRGYPTQGAFPEKQRRWKSVGDKSKRVKKRTDLCLTFFSIQRLLR